MLVDYRQVRCHSSSRHGEYRAGASWTFQRAGEVIATGAAAGATKRTIYEYGLLEAGMATHLGSKEVGVDMNSSIV